MTDYLLKMIREELAAVGVTDTSTIAEWQEKFEHETDPYQWDVLLSDMKLQYRKFDNNKKIKKFITHSKLKIVSSFEEKTPEFPEFFINALAEKIGEKKQHVVLHGDFEMTYRHMAMAVNKLCTSTLNEGLTARESHKFTLPFVITKEDCMKGNIVTGIFSHKKTVPLVSAVSPIKSSSQIYYSFFGEALGRGYRRIATHIGEFYLYKFISDTKKDYVLFSKEKLQIGPCKVTGMHTPITDFVKIGEMAKMVSSVSCFFVQTQEPAEKQIDHTKFKEIVSGWDMQKLSQMIFGEYHHPPWFEKFIMAWLISAKFSGYPLHFAILSKPGCGKSFMFEGIAKLLDEEVFGGGSLRGLVPSFGQSQPSEGYLCQRKRVALIDEFFSVIKTAMNSRSSDLDGGTDKMLRILEHKADVVRTGKGELAIRPRMRCIMASNDDSYSKMRNLVEVSNVLVPAFLSRWLWYVLTDEHKKFIDDRKNKVALLDIEKSMPTYTPDFISVMDYLHEQKVELDVDYLRKQFDYWKQFVPSELVTKIYEPRAQQQLICMADGYAKLNSILENRDKLECTEQDLKESSTVFGEIIMSWIKEVDVMSIPAQHRHKFISEDLRKVYDYVCANRGERTPELRLMGFTAGQLKKLEDYQLVKSVLDTDNTTNLWYPHWARI